MAETDNLKLYKADPIADADKTFNIDTMLNGNWDKIDRAAAEWGNAKILAPKAFKATDSGDEYPQGMSMFYLDADGMEGGWPVNHGQVITWVTARNRLSQFVFETTIATQRIWTRRWSSTRKAWSDFRELETTDGSAQKAAQALEEAKAYTDEKAATIDAPVKSVNGKTGDVVLTADDVGAATKAEFDDLKNNAVVKNGDSVAIGSRLYLNNHGTDNPEMWFHHNGNRTAAIWANQSNGLNSLRIRASKISDSSSGVELTVREDAVFIANRNVLKEIDDLKSSVVDGKGKVAGAINDMGGGPVSANSTFDQMAAAIRSIETSKGDLNFSQSFIDSYGVGVYPEKGFINKSGNWMRVINLGSSEYPKYTLRESTSQGVTVKDTPLSVDAGGVASGFNTERKYFVGDDVVILNRYEGSKGQNYAFDFTGIRLGKAPATAYYIYDVCRVDTGSVQGIHFINGYRPIRVLDFLGAVLYADPDSGEIDMYTGTGVWVSKDKAFISRSVGITSDAKCMLTVLTRVGGSYSSIKSNYATDVGLFIDFIAAHAYR